MNRIRYLIDRFLSGLFFLVGASFLVLLIIIVNCPGHLISLIEGGERNAPIQIEKVREFDASDSKQMIIARSLDRFWALSGSTGEWTLLFFESSEINAASLGNGRFLFWEGVLDLPSQNIDAIVAHEGSSPEFCVTRLPSVRGQAAFFS
ncbi:MAG: hypothetical protein ACREX3_13615 [Gammaproteobacteria bacterium]